MAHQSPRHQNMNTTPQKDKRPKILQGLPPVVPESPDTSRRVQFQDQSKQLHVKDRESYIELSLELKESNPSSYRKALQKMCKTIKDVDPTALIIRHQPEEEKEGGITTSNDAGVAAQAKNALLNFREAIPSYLWQIHRFFPN